MGDFGDRFKAKKSFHPQYLHDQLIENNPKKIQFQNHYEIVLDRPNFQICTPNCLNYDEQMLRSPDNWHQIIISHNGRLTKTQILSALESLTNSAVFIPIAYRSDRTQDSFFVIKQYHALEILFSEGLKFSVNNHYYSITVKIAVAQYHNKQIDAYYQLSKLVSKYLTTIRDGKLDLTNCVRNPELIDLDFSLTNEANFDLFCKCIANQLRGADSLRMLILNRNRIRHLKPLMIFKNFPSLISLTLRNNMIDSMDEFLCLGCLNLKTLNLNGNPIVEGDTSAINEKLMKILPTLEYTDLAKLMACEHRPPAEVVSKINEEVIKVSDINDKFKADFPRRETVKNYWNLVVIEHDGKFDGKEVLNEMYTQFFDSDPCHPCYFKKGEREDSFMLHLNFEPLNILVQNNLKMKRKDDGVVTFRLHLKHAIFNQEQVKWEEVVARVIEKRCTPAKLDLINFRADPELKDIIVCLSSNFELEYVLKLAMNRNPHIIDVDLSHNQLRGLRGLEILKQHSQIKCLDLTHNNISTLAEFPEGLPVIELKMDRNPICDKFQMSGLPSAYEYVRIFSHLCPNLQFIDNKKIDRTVKMVTFQNFFPTPKSYLAVENFVNFFFKKFESAKNRQFLCSIYNNVSRLTVRNGTRKFELQRQVEIIDYYASLPEYEFDYVTMTVDAPIFWSFNPHFPKESIQIVVNGVFRLKDDHEKLFTFCRTFFLKRDMSDKLAGRARGTLSNTYYFHIINEILHFDFARDESTINKAFRYAQATPGEIESAFINDTHEQRFREKLKLLEQTIMMKPQWCRRFLEEANGDFKEALDLFIQFYEKNIFKPEDFLLHLMASK